MKKLKNSFKKQVENKEEKFHDTWAENESIDTVNVIQMNEAITAPEMRYITKFLGNLSGKKLLDLGSGLGEASVYFAIQGADVTACDLSNKMLNFSKNLGKKYNVNIKTHKASANSLNLGNKKFDILYTGNLLHHVDIEKVLKISRDALNENGTFVSWDPLAYNPIINIYRLIATKVRTEDEHPLKLRDLKLFKKYFSSVEYKFFWLFTLVIFVLMFIVQRKNPNKERFWKVVISAEKSWKWLYIPLASMDNILLKVFPFLKIFCWNVVVIAKK